MYISVSPRSALIPLVFFALLSTASITSNSQQHIIAGNNDGNKSPFDDSFEKLVNKTMEFWKVPGLSIAVIDGDDSWAKVSRLFHCVEVF